MENIGGPETVATIPKVQSVHWETLFLEFPIFQKLQEKSWFFPRWKAILEKPAVSGFFFQSRQFLDFKLELRSSKTRKFRIPRNGNTTSFFRLFEFLNSIKALIIWKVDLKLRDLVTSKKFDKIYLFKPGF